MLPDFDTLAREYARYRTGYSRELFDHVLKHAPERPITLDLASGTGLAARGLQPRAGRFVACDLARRMLAASPHGEPVVARAEALPFRSARFDLVTCAQAFHWMEPLPTYRELRRVLRPGGAAAIWWKLPRRDDPTAQAVDRAIERVTGRPAPQTREVWEPLARLDESPFRRAELAEIPQPIEYTVDAYVGMQASRENLRRAAGPEREEVLREIRRALERLHPEGRFVVPYVQRIWILS